MAKNNTERVVIKYEGIFYLQRYGWCFVVMLLKWAPRALECGPSECRPSEPLRAKPINKKIDASLPIFYNLQNRLNEEENDHSIADRFCLMLLMVMR